MNSLPKTVIRQRRDCDLNPGPSATESSTLTTRLPSHPEATRGSHFCVWLCNIPAGLGDDHFGAELVKLVPQLFRLETALQRRHDVIVR